MSSLFGLELPTPVNFIIAFVFVLLLIGAAAWFVRRFGTTAVDAATRGRQPRLAVVDFAAVDGRRKLVIIRRDNVEHLLMIGGPSDVVVETNLVRGTASATRDATPTRPETTTPRMPVADPTPWPLQPEPAPAPVPQLLRNPRAAADEIWDAPPEPVAPPAPPAPEVRPVRPADTLAGLADELAQPHARGNGQVQPLRAAPAPQPVASAQPATPAMDQSLAEMAQRLEAALRRPGGGKVVTETQRVTATLDVKPKSSAQLKPQAQPQPSGNLEQEMASLLSRPGKI